MLVKVYFKKPDEPEDYIIIEGSNINEIIEKAYLIISIVDDHLPAQERNTNWTTYEIMEE